MYSREFTCKCHLKNKQMLCSDNLVCRQPVVCLANGETRAFLLAMIRFVETVLNTS